MSIPEYPTFSKAERAIITEIRAHISPLPLQTVKSDFAPEFLIFKHTAPLKIAWLFPKHTNKKKNLPWDTIFHPSHRDFQGDPSSEG